MIPNGVDVERFHPGSGHGAARRRAETASRDAHLWALQRLDRRVSA